MTRSLPFHHIGGMESVAWDLARAFVRKGCKVTVLTTSCDKLPELSEIDGVNIHTLPTPPGRYSTRWWLLSRRTFISDYLGAIDIVFSVSAGALSLPIKRQDRNPVFIAQIHGTAWGEFKSKIAQRNIFAYVKSIRNLAWMIRDFRYRRFDALIAVGAAVFDDMSKYPTSLIHGDVFQKLIPNGIDPVQFAYDPAKRSSLRRRLQISPDEMVVLSVSRLHAQKGLIEGLEAFALAVLRDSNLRYLIVGAGPDEQRIRTRIEALGLKDKVRLVGSIQRSEISSMLLVGDIFLFTTLREEVGVTMNVMEALAAGLPVVASQLVSTSGCHMFTVNPRDRGGVAEAILDARGVNSRKAALPQRLTLDYAASEYIKLMAVLISARESNRSGQRMSRA